jgi:hypothetical protein
MIGRHLTLLVFLTLGSATARADTLAIHLGELQGNYDGWGGERTAIVRPEVFPAFVTGARMHVEGKATPGSIVCTWIFDQTYRWDVGFFASVYDPETKQLIAGEAETPHKARIGESYYFDFDFEFELFGGAAWDLLKREEYELELAAGGQGYISICRSVLYPELVISKVVLLIDYGGPVATEKQTWGSIKALYRDTNGTP